MADVVQHLKDVVAQETPEFVQLLEASLQTLREAFTTFKYVVSP